MAESDKGRESRTTRRLDMRLPVAVKFGEGEAHEMEAQTRDISARGIFFYVDAPMEPGSPIEFVLTLPPEVTLTDAIRVRCRGKIVRVDEGPGGRFGIAAQIEHYDFLTGEGGETP